jgi:hypothetical protein
LAPFSSIVKLSKTFKEFHKSRSEKDNCWKNNKRKASIRIENDSFHAKDWLLANAPHLWLREVVMANIVENFTLTQIHSKQPEKNILSCFSHIDIKLSTTFKS